MGSGVRRICASLPTLSPARPPGGANSSSSRERALPPEQPHPEPVQFPEKPTGQDSPAPNQPGFLAAPLGKRRSTPKKLRPQDPRRPRPGKPGSQESGSPGWPASVIAPASRAPPRRPRPDAHLHLCSTTLVCSCSLRAERTSQRRFSKSWRVLAWGWVLEHLGDAGREPPSVRRLPARRPECVFHRSVFLLVSFTWRSFLVNSGLIYLCVLNWSHGSDKGVCARVRAGALSYRVVGLSFRDRSPLVVVSCLFTSQKNSARR